MKPFHFHDSVIVKDRVSLNEDRKQVKMPIRWHSFLWLNIMGQKKILFLFFFSNLEYSIDLEEEW